MSETTRRGILGLFGTAAATAVAAPLAASLPTPHIEAPPPELPPCPPRRHCRICDRVFDKGEKQMPFLDFFIVERKGPKGTSVEAMALAKATGLVVAGALTGDEHEKVPLRDLEITSGVDMCCEKCFVLYTHGQLVHHPDGTVAMEKPALSVAEQRVWKNYRERMMRFPGV